MKLPIQYQDHFKLLVTFKDIILFENELINLQIDYDSEEILIGNMKRYYLLDKDNKLIDKIIMNNNIIANTETIQIGDYRDDRKAYRIYTYVALVIVTLFILATILSCGHKAEVKEKYCGMEMSGFEVLDYKKKGDAGYDYTKEDKILLEQLTLGINGLFKDKEKVEVYFATKSVEKIAIYIVAPDDKAMVEQISCYILNSQFQNMPTNRNILFYTNAHNTLVAAVKTKPVAKAKHHQG